MNSLDRYLNELIDFGGIPHTRGEVIAIMQAEGHPQPLIDRWLQGQEFSAQSRARRQTISTRVFVSSVPPPRNPSRASAHAPRPMR